MNQSEIVVNNDKIYHLGLKKGQIAPNIILVGDPMRVFKVSDYFEKVELEVKNREYITHTGSYQGIPVSVIGTGMGTDNVEIALAELYAVHEFDFQTGTRIPDRRPLNIIRVGTSGGVQAHIPAGTLAISTYALGLDNTGLYYDHEPADAHIETIEQKAFEILKAASPKGSRFKGKIMPYASKASSILAAELVFQAQHANLAFETGITASTPGFYGPSARFIEGLSNSVPQIKQQLSRLKVGKKQIINMEMESSILFHMCRQLGYLSGTICPIISNPFSSAQVIDYRKNVRQAIEIALNTLKSLDSRIS